MPGGRPESTLAEKIGRRDLALGVEEKEEGGGGSQEKGSLPED